MNLALTARRAALANLSAAINAVSDEAPYWADLWPSARALAEEAALCDLTETTLFASTDPSITSLPATEISDAAYDAAYRVLSEADMEARAEHDAYLRRCESLGFRDGSWDGEVDGEAAAEWAAMRAMEDAAEIYDLRHGY